MWWKAEIDSSEANTDRVLKSIVLKAVGDKFTTRLNFVDGTFTDIDYARVPRFDLRETLTITPYDDVVVPMK